VLQWNKRTSITHPKLFIAVWRGRLSTCLSVSLSLRYQSLTSWKIHRRRCTGYAMSGCWWPLLEAWCRSHI